MRRALLALTLAAAAASAVADPIRIRARAFDGLAFHDELEVVIEDGVIRSAGPSSGAEAVEQPGAVLTPGFLDLDARYGMPGGDAESQEVVAADLRLADAFAPDEDESETLRLSGVTTAWLLGGSEVVVAGAGAVVQPSPAGPAATRVESWGLSASLASPARIGERAPTSLPDQAVALRTTAAEAGIAGPLRIRFDDGPSLRHAAALGIPVGIPPRDEDLVELGGAAGLVASADWTSIRPAEIGRLVAFMASGRLALGSGDSESGAPAVRLAASRLVEEGAGEGRVLRALTSDAASLLGDPSRGLLREGAVADVVLWSGPPLSLASRPVRAWAGGREILHAP